jgi:hypothetical protein
MKIDLHCHKRDRVGAAFTVFDRFASLRELISEIKKGRCRKMSLPKNLW